MEHSEMRLMDRLHGDIKIQWNPANTDEVSAARKAFDDAKAKGMAFFKMKKSGDQGRSIRSFDAKAKRIVGVPQICGG